MADGDYAVRPLEVVLFENTVKDLKALGLYKPEHEEIIGIYAQLCAQYQVLTDRFVRSKYRIQTKAGVGGMKKAPIVATLEGLRKDILSYAAQLGLTPGAYARLNDSKGKKGRDSPLAAALAKYGEG